MAKKYHHIFFDLDHTLWDFDSNSEATLLDLYHELQLGDKTNGQFEDFHKTYHHHNTIFWERFRKGHINREELRWKRMWRTLVDYKIHDEDLSKEMSERYLEILPTKTALFPGCIDLLNPLSFVDLLNVNGPNERFPFDKAAAKSGVIFFGEVFRNDSIQ